MKLAKYLCDLERGSNDLKVEACEQLAGRKSPRVVAALLQALHDPSRKVQICAAFALGSQRAKEAVPSLSVMLTESEDSVVRAAVAHAVAEIGDKAACPSLLVALGRAEDKDRGFILRALGKIGDVAIVPHLLPFLENDNWEERLDSAYALIELGDSRGIDALELLADDASVPIIERKKAKKRLLLIPRGE